MQTETVEKTEMKKRSLTDSILNFCASGRYGVREAIAAATQRQKRTDQREQTKRHTESQGR